MNRRLLSSLLGRSLGVGFGYTITLMLAGILLVMFNLISADVGERGLALHWIFLSAVVMGLVLGPLARCVAASLGRHVLVWGCVLFFNIASVTIEGKFFAPDLVPDLAPVLLQQLLTCVATALLITWLFASRQAQPPRDGVHRSLASWIWRFLVSSASYLLFYFVFGAINYALFTQSYYVTNPNLDVPTPQLLFVAEGIRAPMIVLSVLPFLLTARMDTRRLALWSGFLLFAIGGVVPLMWQIDTLPLFLLVSSGWEILAQNFLTGVVAALLLAPAQTAAPDVSLQRPVPLGA